MSNENAFYFCEKCGKKLIRRLSNGLWHFAFGKYKDNGKGMKRRPVNMYIHGSVKMECLSERCGHMNTLTYFPQTPTRITQDNDCAEEVK